MLDYYGVKADLSEEERMIQESAREFVDEKVRPNIGEHWIEGTFPKDLIPEMGEMGFYAPTLKGTARPT